MKQRQKILAMLLMSALAVNSFGTVTAVYATEETASESETMDLRFLPAVIPTENLQPGIMP